MHIASRYIRRYIDRLRDSNVRRREMPLPALGAWVVAGGGLLLTYIVLALVLIPGNEPREYHFINERGAITALSALCLAAAAGLAFVSFFISKRRTERLFWLFFSLALGFFALDELMEGHERIGAVLQRVPWLTLPDSFRNWNDVVVISYGIVAVAFLICFLPAILRYPRFLEALAVAIAFYSIHTLIDSTQEPRTTLSAILEESAKLFCSATPALASFIGLLSRLKPVFKQDR